MVSLAQPVDATPGPDYTTFTWWQLALYDFLLWIFSVCFDLFFREIRPRGAFKLPRTGPVIFVGAPHANQFVDPMILMSQVRKESGRRISFLIAAKSYRLKLIGFLSKCQLSIPVERPQDLLNPGTGRIFVDYDADATVVRGEGTRFTSECELKGLIALPRSLGSSEIVAINSDTELVIRKPFAQSEKVVQLLKSGTKFTKAAKVDQKSVYRTVFQHLAGGNCLGIFPEGGSHDRTDLLPIKAGVAIMALGAMEANPNCNVKVVPCGMNYFNAHKFRSRAVIEFGNPIDIPVELVRKYANPDTNREAVKEMLDIITNGLRAVTVTCDSYETLMVVQAARRLYAKNLAQQLPLPLIIEMNRRLVLGYQTYKDEPKIQELKSKIMSYNAKLRQLYLPDHHVENFDDSSNKLRNLSILLFRSFKLLLFFILALPGSILFSPIFIVAGRISSNKKKSALAGSMVKIKANDVVATWKILMSLVFAPIFYILYASIGTFVVYRYQLVNFSLWYVWGILYCFNVLITYSALITGEQGMDIFKSLRPLILSLTDGSSIRELRRFRNELSEDITEIVNEYGPQLFPKDFNLLELKENLKINDKVHYVDSDEEEEQKTQELRQRRLLNRKRRAQKSKQAALGNSNSNSTSSLNTELSLDESKRSDSMSDGVSLLNSDNSLSNIPMFSDYHLIKNKASSARLNYQYSDMSIDDFHFKQTQENGDEISRSSSSIELNFGTFHRRNPSDHLHQNQKAKLSDKIKSKVRENRDKSA